MPPARRVPPPLLCRNSMISRMTFCSAQPPTMRSARFGPIPHLCGSDNPRQPRRPVPPQHGRRLVAPYLEQHRPGLAAARVGPRDPRSQTAEDAPVSKPEMNLDVDAPDKVAGVLTAAAATSYQASAVELSAAWQDRQIRMIWAAIA